MKQIKGNNFPAVIFFFNLFCGKVKNILRFTALFSLVFLFSYSTAYSSSSYYVDNSVGTNGNGTQSSPWKNLSNINWTTISAASKPCTIYVSGGATSQTYNEALVVTASGTSSTWPYSGTPTGEVIIKRPSESEWAGHTGTVYIRSSDYAIDVSSQSNIIIDGLDFRTTGTSHSTGLWGWGSDHIVIRNCTSNTNEGWCIALEGSYFTAQYNNLGPNYTNNGDDVFAINASHWMIENNIIHASLGPLGAGGYHGDGLHFGNGGDEFIIRYNLFRVTDTAYCIYVQLDQNTNSLPTTNVKIYGNIFEKVADTQNATFQAITLECDRAGNPSYNYSTIYVYGNTFVNNDCCPTVGDDSGASIFYRSNCTKAAQRLSIKNNIFYNSKVWIDGTTSGSILTMDYNLYYNTGTISSNGTDIINWKSTEYTSLATFSSEHGFETHGRQGNPNLQSVSGTLNPGHDLRPTGSSSLVIGTGDATLGSDYQNGLSMSNSKSNWPLSVILTGRGVAWDIGAYVYEGGSPNPNPPENLRIVP